MSASDPPPPPPPHGHNPRPPGGLPNGNYDIFIIPPHSAGSGFLYLPSLSTHRNSFLAGVACTLLAVGMYTLVVPVLKDWFATVLASGGAGVLMLVVGVGVAGWAWGKTQMENSRGPPPGGGSSAGAQQQPHSGSQPNATPPPPPHDPPDPKHPPRPSPKPSAASGWEKAREETRKREEARKREEELKRVREEAQKRREAAQKAREENERAAKAKMEKEKWEQARMREKEQREKEQKEREQKEKEQREKEQKEKETRERIAREREARERLVREREALANAQKNKGTARSPRLSPSKTTGGYQKPSARSFTGGTETEDGHSFRPYDRPPGPKSSASSIISGLSESSYAPSHTTVRTTPPPSQRGPYHTKDPDKIKLKAVYVFSDSFPNKPTGSLVSNQGTVTDGLVLHIRTDGFFIDDDIRDVPQREWDVKAWTLKSVEDGLARGAGAGTNGLHVVRATTRDAENKRYIFVIEETEAWKVAVGLTRLRKGSQVRSLGMSGMREPEIKALLHSLGWM